MAVALEQFVKQLADSGVIAPGKLESFVPPKAQPKDAQELARQLVQSKCLTKFQAQEIYSGRAKSLILGNYTLVDKIGAGGMGQVYKAEHRRMHRTVAIKVLPTTLTRDPATIARFQREVEAAAKLEHPNIVTAYDADEAGGVHFLVMQYVEGSDLSALVKKNGPFPIDKAVNYILQAAKGLEFAHAEGVVHRDIKPANLLLDKKGAVKILDMGLARISGGDAETQAELTGTGAVMGTVDYMAPEQALSTKHADARADIYSLGCTLYYLVSAHAAYDGDTLMAKLLAHREKPIPSLGPEASDELQAVFEKMVAKKVQDRYQTMSEVVADLQECSAAKSTVEEPLATSESSLGDSNLSFLAEATAHTHQHTPTKPAKPTKQAKQTKHAAKPSKTSSGWKRRKLLLVGGGLLGGLVVLVGVIFKMPTKDGTLVVEVNQPDATVQVLDEAGTIEITKPGEKGKLSISVDAGKHRLKVEKDGFQFYSQEFVMESGGQQSIKATLEPLAVDLLKLIDPQRDAAMGRWTRVGQSLDSPAIPYACLQVPYDPPQRYELDADMERLELEAAHGSANLGLVVDGHPTVIVIDAAGTTSMTLADAPWDANSTTSYGAIFPVRKHVAIKVVVRPRSVRLLADGKQIFDWHGDPKKLLLAAEWAVEDRRKLFIGAFDNRFRYHALQLIPLAEESSESSDAPGAQPWNTPAFQKWMKEVAAQPAEKQVGAVAKKLQELNPGFDGKEEHRIDNGVVTEFEFHAAAVTDISPVRALIGLKSLNCDGNWALKAKFAELAPLKGMKLTTLSCRDTQVSDLSPLQGMNLTDLNCNSTKVSDLSPLKGMPLTSLNCFSTAVSDLSPLAGMPLTNLNVGATRVSDLSWLRGMPLTSLQCWRTWVADLSPLRGLKLTTLSIGETQVSDLSSLQGMPLTELVLSGTRVTDLSPLIGAPLKVLECHRTSELSPLARLTTLEKLKLTMAGFNSARVAVLQKALPNCKIEWPFDGHFYGQSAPAAKPIATAGDPAFQQWMRDVRDLPAEKQLDAVVKYLRNLNPNYDGTLAGKTIENGAVTELSLSADNLTDLSPVRALAGLKRLYCGGTDTGYGKLSDLSPLRGAALTLLACPNTLVSDLSPLEGMKLSVLHCNSTLVSDLTPLRGMMLTELICWNTPVVDFSPLKGMPIVMLHCGTTPVADLSPLQGMPLKTLWCHETEVADLSPLKGMPLTIFSCFKTDVTDLSPLKGMPLKEVWCGSSLVSDLSPLKESPLRVLACDRTHVTDLSPLQGLNLERIFLTSSGITKGMEVIRQMKSLTMIGTPGAHEQLPPAEFWKRYDAGEFTKPPAAAKSTLDDTAFQQWMKGVAILPAEKQVEAVAKKLQELNPGFDGKETHKIESGMVTELQFVTDNVTDISPVRALVGLRHLNCAGSSWQRVSGRLSDLSPLNGMSLTSLQCDNTQVSDLSPLRGMSLVSLSCNNAPQVSDLSPLHGMPLSDLQFGGAQVSSLSPLHGMPLTKLVCDKTKVFDLSPLQGMNLSLIFLTPKNIVTGMDVIRQMTTIKTIALGGDAPVLQPAEFWKKYDAGEFGKPPAAAKSTLDDPAFQKWMKDVAVLPAEEQVKAVAKKLQELNPGFDGKLKGWARVGDVRIENGVVTGFGVEKCPVADISPVRALTGLKIFLCPRSKVRDLTPLADLPLVKLDIHQCYFVTDLSPLKWMKLAVLECDSTRVADLTPLKGVPLQVLSLGGTKVSDLTPLKGLLLETLFISETPVSDLSPLQGMSLKELRFTPANITKGIEVIRQMKSLEKLSNSGNGNPLSPAEFWKKYDAGEFGATAAK